MGTFVTNDDFYEPAVLFGLLFNAILFYVCVEKLLPYYFKQKKYFKGLLFSFFFFIFICIAESLADYLFISTVYTPSNLRHYPGSTLSFTLFSNFVTNLPFIIIAYLYRFIKDWRANEKAKQVLKEEKLINELQFLKSQINPHFLFNTLNNLFGMARQANAIQVADGIARLSHMMRYMLYDSEVNFVPLEKEISYLENYIELQRLRMGSSSKTELILDINKGSGKIEVAPLLLIPFIENAFKHGVSLKEESKIWVQLNTEGNKINFQVKNTINKLRQNRDEESSGFGLKNVKKRLELIYPGNNKLDISENNNIYSVSLSINTSV